MFELSDKDIINILTAFSFVMLRERLPEKGHAELKDLGERLTEERKRRRKKKREGYRVILTDNFNRETRAESFAIPFSMCKEAADEFAALFNKWFSNEYSSDYWKVVPKNYELFKPDY